MVLSQNSKFPSRFFFSHLQDTQVDDVRMDVMQDLRHSDDVLVLKANRMEKMFKGSAVHLLLSQFSLKKDVTRFKVQY